MHQVAHFRVGVVAESPLQLGVCYARQLDFSIWESVPPAPEMYRNTW